MPPTKEDMYELRAHFARCLYIHGLLRRIGGLQWDELEMETTRGKSATSDVIREARRKIENARAHLLVALGDSYVARQDPTRAVRHFEQAPGPPAR